MQEYFKILNEYGEEWLEDEDYRQEQINRLFFTDEEKYGYYED